MQIYIEITITVY